MNRVAEVVAELAGTGQDQNKRGAIPSVGKARQSATNWHLMPSASTAEVAFQDRCLKPLGHPSNLLY
jgi:hypothetical protein